jgi:uncharacterized membrane protein
VQAPRFIRNGITKLEGNASAGRLAERVRPLAERIGSSKAGPVLRGEWLGHAAHPLMTDLPIGCWTSATVLDLVGGRSSRKAAQRLVGLGVLLVPATALTGWADYDQVDDEATRRVGAVHAVGNIAAAALFMASWRSRRRGSHLRGVVLGLLGGSLTVVTGYLGGHMAFAGGASTEPRGLDGDRVESIPGEPLIDLREASDLLTVPPEQVRAMVSEGMLTPAVAGETLLFERADVMAVRLQGG